MYRRTLVPCLTMLLVVSALALTSESTAFGQAAPWQGGPGLAATTPYYVAQQAPAAPAAPAAPVAPAPAAQPQPEPSPYDLADSSSGNEDPLVRLASVPNMFGDSPGSGNASGGQVFYSDFFSPGSTSFSDLPLAGAIRRVKIAENNKSLPTDRVFFNYNHFHNALDAFDFTDGARSSSLDQYTIGVEKTFLDGMCSVDVRMPFGGAYNFYSADFSTHTNGVGNLSVILKGLLLTTETGVIGAGLGISTPTGDDVDGMTFAAPYVIHNDAVNLAPFVGFLTNRFDPFFLQGFLQVDVPMNGNRVVVDGTQIGKYNEQTLMYIDLETGCWLFRDRPGLLTAMAGILEFHYTTTLQDTDRVESPTLTVTNLNNNYDVVNMTFGVHSQFGELTHLEVGAAVPLDRAPDRFFDAEIQIFLNRMF